LFAIAEIGCRDGSSDNKRISYFFHFGSFRSKFAAKILHYFELCKLNYSISIILFQ
jgi:hypothetical protein